MICSFPIYAIQFDRCVCVQKRLLRVQTTVNRFSLKNLSSIVIFFLKHLIFQACKNDNACILDVALTGNMSFAVVFAELESEIEEASQASELFRESEPEWANWEEEALEEWGHSGGEKIVGKLSMVIMALFATLCLAIH